MLVDNFVSRSSWLANWIGDAQIIRVPFSVANDPDETLSQFLPFNRKTAVWDYSLIRFPFKNMLLFSDKTPNSVIIVNVSPLPDRDRELSKIDEDVLVDVVSLTLLQLNGKKIISSPLHSFSFNRLKTSPVYHTHGFPQPEMSAMINAGIFEPNMMKSHPLMSKQELLVWLLQNFQSMNNSIAERNDINRLIDDEALQIFVVGLCRGFAILFATVALMNCKNVIIDKVTPEPNLQLIRKKNNKPPFVSYGILKVKPILVHRRGQQVNHGDERLAVHWRRGHFKTFTETKKLLGKLVGTWWWQPSLVGRTDHYKLNTYDIP